MPQAKQRKGLDSILEDTLGGESPAEVQEDSAEVVELAPPKKNKIKPSKVTTSLYLPKAVHKQVRELAFSEDVKPHDLYLEALDMLFKQRGLKPIKSLTSE